MGQLVDDVHTYYTNAESKEVEILKSLIYVSWVNKEVNSSTNVL